MYLPPPFAESRPEVLHELIRSHPLGALITVSPPGLEANHIPFLLVPGEGAEGSLIGHVSRRNPVAQIPEKDREALVIFQGPSAYLSPSWYPTKKEDGKVVPTWNYVAVHAHGLLKLHDDPAWVMRQVELLTRHMEAPRPDPWAVSDAPGSYLEQLAGAIVGIEVVIDRIVGKWKVSQNQPPANRSGAAAGLEAGGQPSAAEMAKLIRERSEGRQAP